MIRRFFNELGWSDEAGSGVRNVTKYLKVCVKGAKPEFIEDDIFVTRIPIAESLLKDRFLYLQELFGIPPSIMAPEEDEVLSELSIDPGLDGFNDKDEFIRFYMGTLIKNGRNLSEIKLLRNNVIILKDEINTESSEEIGGKLFTKKGARMLRALVGLMSEKSLE